MKNLPQISDAEFEIMKVIWSGYPISTNDITNVVMKTNDWNERTVHTLISRLAKKGAITHKKDGRTYIYSPVIKKSDYINSESKSFLNKFYNGTVNKMILNFVENNMLSDKEVDELKNILNKR
jgi:penicillinase repressor